jgi:hypothetical protein
LLKHELKEVAFDFGHAPRSDRALSTADCRQAATFGAMPDVVLYTGIAIEAGAGALTSFSMVVQRHALIHENARSDDQKVPLGCCRLRRRYAWFLGLVLYGIAAGMKVVGFNMGPFTILGSIFVGVLLVTNLVLGHWLLREELTMTKVLGSLLVLAGAIVCTAAAPSGVPTSFSTEAMRALILRAPPFGGSYFACVLGVVLLCLVFIIVIEKRYPVPKGAQGGPGTPGSPLRLASTAWLPQRVARPSTCLSLVMLVVYPGSLGLNESFVDACARAYSSMIVRCVTEAQEGLAACHDWSLYLLMGLGIPAAVSTAYWLKVVFARYQTTLAIPIEYSTLNFFSVVGGLLFFQEAEYMEPWQLEFVLIGCSVMTVGGFVLVAVGLQEELLSKRVAGWTSPDHLAGPASTADAAPGTASCRRVAQTPAPAAVNVNGTSQTPAPAAVNVNGTSQTPAPAAVNVNGTSQTPAPAAVNVNGTAQTPAPAAAAAAAVDPPSVTLTRRHDSVTRLSPSVTRLSPSVTRLSPSVTRLSPSADRQLPSTMSGCAQRSSEVIRGHQRSSATMSGFTRARFLRRHRTQTIPEPSNQPSPDKEGAPPSLVSMPWRRRPASPVPSVVPIERCDERLHAMATRLQRFYRRRRMRRAWYTMIDGLREWNLLVQQINAAKLKQAAQARSYGAGWPSWLWPREPKSDLAWSDIQRHPL